MPAVRVRGIDIYYEEHGSTADPCLIMAHGLLGSIAATPRFGERADDIAARGLHVVAYDARGHGRSGYTTRRSDYRWAAMAEDMAALMQALGIDRASVYGGSMGAGTALMLALAHPERVERLILQSPPPFGTDVKAARQTLGGLADALSAIRHVGSGAHRHGAAADAPHRSRGRSRRHARVPRRGSGARRSCPRSAACCGGPSDPGRTAGRDHAADAGAHAPGRRDPPAAFGRDPARENARTRSSPSRHRPRTGRRIPHALTHVVAAFVRGEEIARGLPRKAPHDHAPA